MYRGLLTGVTIQACSMTLQVRPSAAEATMHSEKAHHQEIASASAVICHIQHYSRVDKHKSTPHTYTDTQTLAIMWTGTPTHHHPHIPVGDRFMLSRSILLPDEGHPLPILLRMPVQTVLYNNQHKRDTIPLV